MKDAKKVSREQAKAELEKKAGGKLSEKAGKALGGGEVEKR